MKNAQKFHQRTRCALITQIIITINNFGRSAIPNLQMLSHTTGITQDITIFQTWVRNDSNVM